MCLAIPGKILSILNPSEEFKMAKVSFGGINKEVYLQFTPEAKIGDYVLVHVGFALNVIDEEEAKKTLDILREMGDIE